MASFEEFWEVSLSMVKKLQFQSYLLERQFHNFLIQFLAGFYVWPNWCVALPWHTAEATYVAATEQPLWSLERCWCWGCYLLLSYTVLSTSLEVDKQAASEKKQLEGGLRTSDTIECMKNSRGKMASHSLPISQSYLCSCISVRIKAWLRTKVRGDFNIHGTRYF